MKKPACVLYIVKYYSTKRQQKSNKNLRASSEKNTKKNKCPFHSDTSFAAYQKSLIATAVALYQPLLSKRRLIAATTSAILS
jgi:hypothetical protein